MSERVGTFLQEDISLLAPQTREEVQAVQNRIVSHVLLLVRNGQITLPEYPHREAVVPVAEQVTPQHFVNGVLAMSDRDLQYALRQIHHKDLVVGLKDSPAPVRERFLGNMSLRSRLDFNRKIDDIDASSEEIAETQSRIAAQLRRLATGGKIEFPDTGI